MSIGYAVRVETKQRKNQIRMKPTHVTISYVINGAKFEGTYHLEREENQLKERLEFLSREQIIVTKEYH